MPEQLERALQQEARKHHFKPGGKRWNAYVHGTIARIERGKLGKKRKTYARKRFSAAG